ALYPDQGVPHRTTAWTTPTPPGSSTTAVHRTRHRRPGPESTLPPPLAFHHPARCVLTDATRPQYVPPRRSRGPPQTSPLAALPYPILRHLSRPRGAASAVGKAWPRHVSSWRDA